MQGRSDGQEGCPFLPSPTAQLPPGCSAGVSPARHGQQQKEGSGPHLCQGVELWFRRWPYKGEQGRVAATHNSARRRRWRQVPREGVGRCPPHADHRAAQASRLRLGAAPQRVRERCHLEVTLRLSSRRRPTCSFHASGFRRRRYLRSVHSSRSLSRGCMMRGIRDRPSAAAAGAGRGARPPCHPARHLRVESMDANLCIVHFAGQQVREGYAQPACRVSTSRQHRMRAAPRASSAMHGGIRKCGGTRAAVHVKRSLSGWPQICLAVTYTFVQRYASGSRARDRHGLGKNGSLIRHA